MTNSGGAQSIRVVIIGEYSPPFAGMAVQAEALMTIHDPKLVTTRKIGTNYYFKGPFSFLNRIRGLRGLLRYIAFLVQLRKIFSVDIIHVFSSSGLNFYLFTVVPILLSRLAGIPLIINYHGGNAGAFFQNRVSLLDWSLKKNTSLVVPSGFLQDIFREFGKESFIIPNVIKTDRFEFVKRNVFRPVIVVCRNFTPVYNVGCAIKAFDIVSKECENAKLILAGDGPERKDLEALVQKLGLQNVQFLGNIPNEQMNAVYQSADIFLNTSRVDNMPNCILEAMACGLPVISTDVGGIPYLVTNTKTGLLAPSDDSARLAELILKVIGHENYARELVEAAYASLQHYTANSVRKNWLEYYQTLCR